MNTQLSTIEERRKAVERAIASEREYQVRSWGVLKQMPDGTPVSLADISRTSADFLCFMDHYIEKVSQIFSTKPGISLALEEIRKIAALAKAATEQVFRVSLDQDVLYQRIWSCERDYAGASFARYLINMRGLLFIRYGVNTLDRPNQSDFDIESTVMDVLTNCCFCMERFGAPPRQLDRIQVADNTDQKIVLHRRTNRWLPADLPIDTIAMDVTKEGSPDTITV